MKKQKENKFTKVVRRFFKELKVSQRAKVLSPEEYIMISAVLESVKVDSLPLEARDGFDRLKRKLDYIVE